MHRSCDPFPGLNILLWTAPGHSQMEILPLHHCCLLLHFSFLQFHLLYTSAPPKNLWSPSQGMWDLYHHLRGVLPIRGVAERPVAFATIKSVSEKWRGEVIPFPSSHCLWGKLWKMVITRSFTNALRHILAFLRSCGLLLSWLPVGSHPGNTQVCLSLGKPWGYVGSLS